MSINAPNGMKHGAFLCFSIIRVLNFKSCILESLYIVEDNGDGTFSIVWDEDGEDYVSEARYSGARSLH